MRRFHEAARDGAKEVVACGSGPPKRESLHVADWAAASEHVMGIEFAIYASQTRPAFGHVSIGTGHDCSIRELADTVARVIGLSGRLVFDSGKADGSPPKLSEVSRLAA